MVITDTNYTDFKTVAELAKQYPNLRRGGVGVSKVYIYYLIQKELEQPNSTDIDVLQVCGQNFAKIRLK